MMPVTSRSVSVGSHVSKFCRNALLTLGEVLRPKGWADVWRGVMQAQAVSYDQDFTTALPFLSNEHATQIPSTTTRDLILVKLY